MPSYLCPGGWGLPRQPRGSPSVRGCVQQGGLSQTRDRVGTGGLVRQRVEEDVGLPSPTAGSSGIPCPPSSASSGPGGKAGPRGSEGCRGEGQNASVDKPG